LLFVKTDDSNKRGCPHCTQRVDGRCCRTNLQELSHLAHMQNWSNWQTGIGREWELSPSLTIMN